MGVHTGADSACICIWVGGMGTRYPRVVCQIWVMAIWEMAIDAGGGSLPSYGGYTTWATAYFVFFLLAFLLELIKALILSQPASRSLGDAMGSGKRWLSS